jgi:hypothetical protein
MTTRFTSQNEVETLNEPLVGGDIITVKLRSHLGHDSQNRCGCQVTESLRNKADRTLAQVHFVESQSRIIDTTAQR